MNKSIFSWVEIPVIDMDRAVMFYETVLGIKLQRMKLANDLEMSFITSPTGEVAGALCKYSEYYKPSVDGPLVYLTANPSIDIMQLKITSAKGKILREKTNIKPNTYMALFIDSEGNRMALLEEN
ncbi:MAG: VOC family protein [Bacteroidetes bacterium]|nr:VOC family protein [Bacteroidota bacterium]